MSQAQDGNSGQHAVERAEALLDQLGQGIGSFAARMGKSAGLYGQSETGRAEEAGQRQTLPNAVGGRLAAVGQGIGSFATRIRERTGQPGQPETGRTEGAGQPQVMQRAEGLVDEMGQRVGRGSSRVGLQMRKIAARMGEEVEDMWAEAQQIRSGSSGKPR
jgi:hypothetical protein